MGWTRRPRSSAEHQRNTTHARERSDIGLLEYRSKTSESPSTTAKARHRQKITAMERLLLPFGIVIFERKTGCNTFRSSSAAFTGVGGHGMAAAQVVCVSCISEGFLKAAAERKCTCGLLLFSLFGGWKA